MKLPHNQGDNGQRHAAFDDYVEPVRDTFAAHGQFRSIHPEIGRLLSVARVLEIDDDNKAIAPGPDVPLDAPLIHVLLPDDRHPPDLGPLANRVYKAAKNVIGTPEYPPIDDRHRMGLFDQQQVDARLPLGSENGTAKHLDVPLCVIVDPTLLPEGVDRTTAVARGMAEWIRKQNMPERTLQRHDTKSHLQRQALHRKMDDMIAHKVDKILDPATASQTAEVAEMAAQVLYMNDDILAATLRAQIVRPERPNIEHELTFIASNLRGNPGQMVVDNGEVSLYAALKLIGGSSRKTHVMAPPYPKRSHQSSQTPPVPGRHLWLVNQDEETRP